MKYQAVQKKKKLIKNVHEAVKDTRSPRLQTKQQLKPSQARIADTREQMRLQLSVGDKIRRQKVHKHKFITKSQHLSQSQQKHVGRLEIS